MKALFRMFLLVSCTLTGTGNAQTLPEARFAVEVPGRDGGPPIYFVLRGASGSGLLFDAVLRRAAGREPTRRQPATLKLDHNVDGDLVRITASVFFGNLDAQANPGSTDALPWQKVGAYSAGLNQSVTLQEMEQFGLEPLTLKIVSAQPPASARPQTVSKAPSVRIEIVGEDRNSYTVAVHNLSQKIVTAFSVEMSGEGDSGRSVIGSRHLIAPGDTYQFEFGVSRSGSMSSGRFVEDPPSSLMTLEAAVFKDSSYEGNPRAAAELAARDSQRRRVDDVIAEIMADAASGEEARIARIRSAVARLPEEPDPQAVENLRSQFPGLSDEDMGRVKSTLKSALNVEKQAVTRTLNELRPGTLTVWWDLRQK
jgi:hypothetical protein